MKKLLFVVFMMSAFRLGYASELDLQQIQRAIEQAGAQWTAGENAVTLLSAEERSYLTGALPVNPDEIDPQQILTLPAVALPDSFDWRNADGNWLTGVRDQGQCGSCWAFSALGQVEAWWKITNGDPTADIDLSEQSLLSCSDAGDCEQGGWVWKSLDFIRNTGIALEADLPYRAKSDVPCSDAKSGWQERGVTIPGWGFITMDDASVNNIKNAVFRHPLSVSYEVFQDFYSYSHGVYEHVIGKSTGWHAVVIVGWNDREQSWIVKNSWGKGWGDHGYFRIKWGDSSMGRFAPFIWDDMQNSFLFPSVSTIDTQLTFGDSEKTSFVLGNYGDAPLQFFINVINSEPDDPEWLEIENGAGSLDASERDTIRLVIDTRKLDPGEYAKTLKIVANDVAAADVQVDVSLTVARPDDDVRLDSLVEPEDGFTLLSWADVGCVVENIGLEPMTDFDLVCRIMQNGAPVLFDTTHVDVIPAEQSLLVDVGAFKPMLTGELDFDFALVNAENDYNDFNNTLNAVAKVTNLVESYEDPGDRWDLQGGWAFSDQLNGHDGGYSAHVNGGVFPYPENMNAQMTYLPGFELQNVDTLFVSFWTRYVMADSNDICFVQVSVDSTNWSVRDQFTGVQPAWKRHVLNLTDLAQGSGDKVWLRFSFVSDAIGGSIGALIDDLEVYTHTIATESETHQETFVQSASARKPTDFRLEQNYPNPFNPSTVLAYSLPRAAHVRLAVYNLNGRLAAVLVNASQASGRRQIEWNASELPSGVYFYVLEAQSDGGERFVARKKMALIR